MDEKTQPQDEQQDNEPSDDDALALLHALQRRSGNRGIANPAIGKDEQDEVECGDTAANDRA